MWVLRSNSQGNSRSSKMYDFEQLIRCSFSSLLEPAVKMQSTNYFAYPTAAERYAKPVPPRFFHAPAP